MLSIDTQNSIATAEMPELEEMLLNIAWIISERADCDEVITMLSDNGVELTTEANGEYKICQRKRPN